MLWNRIISKTSTPDPAWNLAFASFTGSAFSVSAQGLTPTGVFFKPDGTKMYVIDAWFDNVNEYNLSTAWSISTASYLQQFSVFAQEGTPVGIFFKPDGTKMYIVGSAGDDVNEYNLGTAWNISTASYVQNFSVAGEDTVPQDVFFKPDGTKMYIVGSTGDDVNEYNLGTAWNISTASYVQNFSVAGEDSIPAGVFFKPDGTKMYVIGASFDRVNEYNLGTAWNISTASYVQNFSVAAQDTNPSGVFFEPDGTKMYVSGNGTDKIYEYDLS